MNNFFLLNHNAQRVNIYKNNILFTNYQITGIQDEYHTIPNVVHGDIIRFDIHGSDGNILSQQTNVKFLLLDATIQYNDICEDSGNPFNVQTILGINSDLSFDPIGDPNGVFFRWQYGNVGNLTTLTTSHNFSHSPTNATDRQLHLDVFQDGIEYQDDFGNQHLIRARSALFPFILNYSLPITSITGNNSVFCGDDAVFTINGSNISVSEWYSDSAGVNVIFNSGNTLNYDISSFNPGTYTIYVKATDTNGCDSDIMPVTFQKISTDPGLSLPTLLSGSLQTVCSEENSNIELSGYPNYEWVLSDVAGNISNIPVNDTKFTNASKNNLNYLLVPDDYKYWVRGKTNQNCYTEWSPIEWSVIEEVGTVDLEISTFSNFTPRTDFCVGDDLILVATSDFADEFDLFINNVLIETEDQLITSGNTQQVQFNFNNTDDLGQGIHNIKIVSKNVNTSTCGFKEIIVPITLHDLPEDYTLISDQIFYNIDDTVTITASGQNSNSFNWFFDQNLNNPLANNAVEGVSNLIITNNGLTISFTITKEYNPAKFNLYAVGSSDFCLGEAQIIEFNVYENLGNVSVDNNGHSVCRSDDLFLTASATDATNFIWYENSDGTVQAGTGQIYDTNTSNTTPIGVYNLWVKAQIIENNIVVSESPLFPVTYTVLLKPQNPVHSGDFSSYCRNDLVDIDVSASDVNNQQAIFSYDVNFNNLIPLSRVKSSGVGLSWNIDQSDVDAGIRFIYYKLVNDNGCESDSNNFSFVVNDSPTNLVVTNDNSDNTICFGETITFFASATNANSYQYVIDDIIVSNNSNTYETEDDLTTGDHIVKVSALNNNNCSSVVFQQTITVNEQPSNNTSITGNTTYCVGDDALINFIADNATGFNWYSDSLGNNEITSNVIFQDFNSISKSQINIANIQNSITYYYKAINNNGCNSTLQSIFITVNPQVGNLTVNGNNNTYCTGDDIVIVSGSVNASNYSWWTNSDLTISAETLYGNTVVTGTNDDTLSFINNNLSQSNYTFYLVAENQFGCNSDVLEVSFDVGTTPTSLQINTIEDYYCTNQLLTIIPSATNADFYEFAYDSNFNNLVEDSKIIGNNLSYIPNSSDIGITDYYVRAVSNNNCNSNVFAFEIEVRQGVENFNINNSNWEVCQGEIVNIGTIS